VWLDCGPHFACDFEHLLRTAEAAAAAVVVVVVYCFACMGIAWTVVARPTACSFVAVVAAAVAVPAVVAEVHGYHVGLSLSMNFDYCYKVAPNNCSQHSSLAVASFDFASLAGDVAADAAAVAVAAAEAGAVVVDFDRKMEAPVTPCYQCRAAFCQPLPVACTFEFVDLALIALNSQRAAYCVASNAMDSRADTVAAVVDCA